MQYCIAVIRALADEPDAALPHLAKAILKDPEYRILARKDEAFKHVRKLGEYKKIILG